MIRAFVVHLDEEQVDVFVTKIDHDVWRQLRRAGKRGWLVSIPIWNWSCFVKEGTDALDDVRFWISQLASAYTDDEAGIYRVAEEITRRC